MTPTARFSALGLAALLLLSACSDELGAPENAAANAAALDFETNPQFELLIAVHDDGENPLTDTATAL